MPTALLSVHDKTGLVPFAERLSAAGYDLVASGGTAKALLDAGLSPLAVEDLTGFPELLDGRVKTLHPAVHAGILSRRSAVDQAQLAEHGLREIDLVAVSLYPFEKALAADAPDAELIEQIDIGGVALIRAAAKNYAHVMVVPGPGYYDEVLAALGGDDQLEGSRSTERLSIGLEVRRRMAGIALAITSLYDRTIAHWLAATPLRYGENPHQFAWFQPEVGAGSYRKLAGKDLSYNNLLDLDAAWVAVGEAPPERAAAVIVKHGSPCGIAWADSAAAAIAHAVASDPVSAFGGIVALNRPFDLEAMHALGELFIEVVAAPEVADEALEAMKKTRKNCRVVTLDLALGLDASPRVRSVLGGLLVQSPDLARPEPDTWQTATRRAPDAQELARLAFAWHAVKHVKSNAIVLAGGDATALYTVGIGGGQTNRIDAVRQACERAGERARGAVLASDAFFPFSDGVEAAAAAGVAAVAQPGGAMRDDDVIAAADRLGLAMVLTERRHFRH